MTVDQTPEPALIVDDRGLVQVWTMQLAPVNAINTELLDALDAALDSARSSDVAAVVLASGLRVFSAGADATWMAETVTALGPAGLLENFNATMNHFREVCIRLRNAPHLVIAAVGGHALAGGLELAAACDLRFVTDDERLRIGVPEMDLFGCLPTGGGGAQFLARIMGPSRALEFMLDAKPINPSQARAVGLVDRLCSDATAQATEFATQVADKAGRMGVRAAKRAVFYGVEQPLASAMVLDGSLHWDNMRRGKFLPGVEAFTQQFASGPKK